MLLTRKRSFENDYRTWVISNSIEEMNDSNRSISVILPAYNEEGNIVQIVKAAFRVLKQIFREYEIIVVNDGSTDHTREIVKDLADRRSNLHLINHPVNIGYGASLKSGIVASKNELIFFTDSDLQFDIAELEQLLRWITDFDIVIGYRSRRKDPLLRRINAWGWGILVQYLFTLDVKDIDCAFKLFTREVFENISIDSIGAFVNTEILVRAKKLGYRLYQVPVTHYARVKGKQSGAKPGVVLKAFHELFLLYRELQQ
jgi:glycosyltransferase involved in cell wall biosynthesis